VNIAFFVSNLNKYSGAAFQSMTLAKSLPKGYRIYFFNKSSSSGYKPAYQLDGFSVIDLPSNRLMQIMITIKYADRWKIDLFHMHGFSIAAVVASIVLRKMSVLKTTLIGYDDFETWSKSTNGQFKLRCLHFVDINVVLSSRAYKINSAYNHRIKVVKIPNGILLPTLSSEEERKAFCIVGVIHQRKRTLECIKYFIHNYSIHSSTKLYVVGPLTNEDNLTEFSAGYISKCERIVNQAGLQHKIIFTGKLKKNEVQRIYRESIALLFFSTSEGMPNVVLEAMGNNCVPIITDLGGDAYELFENSKEGFILLDMKESIDLHEIQQVSNSGAVRERSKDYSINKIATIYSNLYLELANDKRSN